MSLKSRGCALLRRFGIFDRAEMHGRRRNFVRQRRYHKYRRNAAVIASYQTERKLPTALSVLRRLFLNVPIICHVTFLSAFLVTEMMKISV